MSLWGWITGGGEAAEKVVSGVYDGIDAAIYTDEEKARASQKILDWKLEWLKATSPSRVARRIIALIVTGTWALLLFIAVGAKAYGADAFSDFTFQVLSDNVKSPLSIILGFYFLAHLPIGKRAQ